MYIVYQTTNLINGKIYIGVHNCDNDSYVGSGKLIRRAIKKHGTSNFQREILETFETKEEAFNYEAEVVNEDFVNRPDTYNISTGGVGYKEIGKITVDNKIGIHSKDYTKEMRSKVSKETMARRTPEDKYSMCSKGGKIGGQKNLEEKLGIFSESYTDEDRKMSSKMGIEKQREFGLSRFSSVLQSKLGKIGGPKNKGFKWYTDGVEAFKYTVAQQDELPLEDFLKNNPQYYSGRPKREFKSRPSTQGFKWYTDGVSSFRYTTEEQNKVPFDVFLSTNTKLKAGKISTKGSL